MPAAPTREQRPMTHFAIYRGYICTASPDGSVHVNARIAATLGYKDDSVVAGVLVSQANAAADLLAALQRLCDHLEHIPYRDSAQLRVTATPFYEQARRAIALAAQEERP